MPLQRCQDDGQPGWKWGDAGKCYVYTSGDDESEMAARKKAMKQAAAMGEFPGTGHVERRTAPPVEFRAANMTGVDVKQRIIEVIAVPYEEPAQIEYRGSFWSETFDRGSFDGIESRDGSVYCSRDHDRTRPVGLVAQWWPERAEGLVAEAKIADTPLGDETLALAKEKVLKASLGFAAKPSDQILDKRRMTRRIRRAFVDHLAFTVHPAYTGAQVLDVRTDEKLLTAASLPPLAATPAVDQYVEFLARLRAS